jgi:hypothetical protein
LTNINIYYIYIHKIALKRGFFDRYIPSIDGNWGGLVDAKSNAFNGMIGMIQRQVSLRKFTFGIE